MIENNRKRWEYREYDKKNMGYKGTLSVKDKCD